MSLERLTHSAGADPVDFFMRGQCHLHAVAAHHLHGGFFAVCYDHSDVFYESDDDDDCVSSVIHVWSVHETPNGLMARDVLGDIPWTTEALRNHIEQFFPEYILGFQVGDVALDMNCTLEEVLDLAGDEPHHPLHALSASDIEATMAIPSVQLPPGDRLYHLDPSGCAGPDF